MEAVTVLQGIAEIELQEEMEPVFQSLEAQAAELTSVWPAAGRGCWPSRAGISGETGWKQGGPGSWIWKL